MFDARAIDRARCFKKLRAFFVARADGRTVSRRPKSRYPGASPCAMGQRQLSLLARGRAAQSPPAVMDRRAGHRGFSRSKPLKPLRAERRMLRRARGDYARALVFIAHEAADAFAHPAFRAPSFEGDRS